jgi:hypothetical protein
MIIKNASIVTFDDSSVEWDSTDTRVNTDVHMYYYHIRPPNFDLTSKSIHFCVKFLKNVIDFIHGIESGFKLCCIISYLRGKAVFIRPNHQYYCYKCMNKINKGNYKDRNRLSNIKIRASNYEKRTNC